MSKSMKKNRYLSRKISKRYKSIKNKLTPLQLAIAFKAETEQPFTGTTSNGFKWDNQEPGIYYSLISHKPLFKSEDKFSCPCGWMSFSKPIKKNNIILRPDPQDIKDNKDFIRNEVLESTYQTHLGHLFDDHNSPSRKRYCINANMLIFKPKKKIVQSNI